MSRPVALVAFLALSWSHAAGLRCDMGAGALAMDETHADASAEPATPSHSHHAARPGDGPPHPPDHDGGHGCLMIMACSVASPRPAQAVTMVRVPTVLVRAAFPAPPHPVAADLAVETPPPRSTV